MNRGDFALLRSRTLTLVFRSTLEWHTHSLPNQNREGTRNSPRVRHKSTTTGYALSLPIFFRSHCSHARRRRWVDWANGFFTFSFHYPLMMMDSMIAAAGLAFGVETPTRKIQLFCTTGPARRWKIAYFGAWVLRVPFSR